MIPLKNFYSMSGLTNTLIRHYSLISDDKATLARTIIEKSHYPKIIAYKIFNEFIDSSRLTPEEKNQIWNKIKKEQISLVQNSMSQIYVSHMLIDLKEKDVTFLNEFYNHRHDEVIALVDEFAEIKIQESEEVFSKEINQRKKKNFEDFSILRDSFKKLIDANDKKDFIEKFIYREFSEIDTIAHKTIYNVSFASTKMILQVLNSEIFKKE